MSVAALAEWLASGAATVPGAGFVTLLPPSPAEKVTPKNDPLRGKNGVCNLVTSVTPFFAEVEVKCDESRPDQAANGAPEPAPAAADRIESAREQARMDWRQADRAYLNHHFRCPTCISAGKGYGKRCPTGLDLWNAYEAACDADRLNTINTRGRKPR